MVFTPKYTDEDFLTALDRQNFRTAAYIAKKVGCKLDTAKMALTRLAEAGKVERMEIDDGNIIAYRSVLEEIDDNRIFSIEEIESLIQILNKQITATKRDDQR